MKKQILLALAMLASVSSFAQNKVGTFSIQPKLGLNVSSITDASNSDARIGLVTGAEFEYQASRLVSISFGALYSMQGCKLDDVSMKLDYINIPVLANFYVTKGLALKVGLQPGFKVNYKYTRDGYSVDGDKLDKTNAVDLSLPMGISYEFSNFVIDGRYNLGLTGVFDGDDDNYRNSVLQLTVGYKFHL